MQTDRIAELRAMIPSKFRKKPVVIEAFQVGSSRFYPEWLHEAVSANVVVTYAREGSDGWKEPFDHADIQTPEGVMRADRGDWIIRGVGGELYPCKDSIFRQTYEPAEDGEPPAQQPEPVRVWYMRDNHTFLELPLDIDEAISALRDEWPSGQTCGTLCSKEVNEEVHAHGEIEPFIAEVRAWYDRHGIGKGDSK